ncbi:phosphotransferase enzyme family protein [Aspergillus ibericus CBS 121593]|uniref:Altered inheritance of mitochondria protein 9, mitochondrial n=1 Tax=Aspergillus ibericus CBS 121593 TaxID=1448316 RepID=A0A395GK13_9EURO|nr:phosphotransferase enzyme family protein [Aspergillus ibericus CBS 121593]RAK95744.1 phosphotransferase enzyme family protein [Aspergillus ibericus CBS 121593]
MYTLRDFGHLRQRIRPSISNGICFCLYRIAYPRAWGRQQFQHWNSCQLHTSSTPAPRAGISAIDCNEESLYRYTSGRWLWNEKEQLSRRYVEFNLDELARIAMQVTGSQSGIQVQKLREGNFNKVFLITMDDNKEVIAKLPNPNAGRPHFTTASEVATMDYVRNVLNVPTPQVYSWSSSTENPVGAEYIIMEKSRGLELSKLWDGMPGSDKFQIVKQLVGFEKRLTSSRFPMYGSLYYAKDLPEVQPNQLVGIGSKKDTVDTVFAVGPTTNRTFFDDGRDAVDVNRGPWESLEDYVLSRAYRELACVQSFPTFPRPQGFFYGPGQYQPTAESKQKTLQNYIKVAPLLLPKDKELSKPVLWHPDLHGDNIFVNPDQPTEILSIIDWQAVNLSPLFLQARHPAIVEFDGPIPEGLESINLPDNFDELSPEEQLDAKKLRAAQSLYKLYDIQLIRQCPEIAHALRFKDSLSGQITGLAGSLFSDGEPIVQGMLIKLQEEWSSSIGPSIPCPLSFTAEEKETQREDAAKWAAGVELMEEFLHQVGAYRGWDGWVNHDNYELYKERFVRCREQFMNRHSVTDEERNRWRAVWPFKDN